MTAKTERQHGTRAKYVRDNCHCQACRDANRQHFNNRYRQIAYGRWQPYVDAEPARQHAAALIAAGVPRRTLVELPGVSRGSLESLLYGRPAYGKQPSKRIRAEHAQAILSVPIPKHVDGSRAKTDATGTRRRIQALIAAGWPLQQLARRLGAAPQNFRRTLLGPSPYVTTATEQAVRRLYDQLWKTDPITAGVSDRSTNEARAWARREQWAPVGAWDEDAIDDPAAIPDWTGRCGTLRGYRVHYEAGIRPVCAACRAAKAAYDQAKKHAA